MNVAPRATREEVMSVPRPNFTDTWSPWAHSDIIGAMDKAVKALGLTLEEERYSMNGLSTQMTAVWIFHDPRQAKGIRAQNRIWHIRPSIIFRNSIDKMRSFAVNVGTDDPICTNLALRGDFLEFRKHTGGFSLEELEGLAYSGAERMADKFYDALKFHRNMSVIRLTEGQTRELAYEAIISGALSRHKIDYFNQILFSDEREYDPTRLFGFHGAVTQTHRELNYAQPNFLDRQKFLDTMLTERFPSLN